MENRESLFRDVDARLLKRWTKFHMTYPEVYAAFKLKALKVWARGFKRYSAWTILTAIRFEYDLTLKEREVDEFKINNDFVALYARKFLYDHPRLEKFFELRKMKRKRKLLSRGKQ